MLNKITGMRKPCKQGNLYAHGVVSIHDALWVNCFSRFGAKIHFPQVTEAALKMFSRSSITNLSCELSQCTCNPNISQTTFTN